MDQSWENKTNNDGDNMNNNDGENKTNNDGDNMTEPKSTFIYFDKGIENFEVYTLNNYFPIVHSS